MKKEKIGVIGAGHVGSHVASALSLGGLCDEIVLVDCDADKVRAQAIDLADAAVCFPRPVAIAAGGYDKLADAALVVMAACDGILEEDRLLELDNTVRVAQQILPRLKDSGFCGVVVSITNPCDIIAQYLAAGTGLTVIGTGTALDSARLRLRIAQAAGVAPASVEAYCLGEHGDSQVAALSSAVIGGRPVQELCSEAALAEAARCTISAGWEIAAPKGSTEFGIGSVAAALCAAILRDERRVIPCSAMLNGEYGERGVYASLPRVIGAAGVLRTLTPELNPAERESFARSCAVLRANCRRIGLCG